MRSARSLFFILGVKNVVEQNGEVTVRKKRKVDTANIAAEFYLRICAQVRVSADYHVRKLVAAELLHGAHRARIVYRIDIAAYALAFSALRELFYRAKPSLHVVNENVAQVILVLEFGIVFSVHSLPLYLEARFRGFREVFDFLSVHKANRYRKRGQGNILQPVENASPAITAAQTSERAVSSTKYAKVPLRCFDTA